VPPPKASAPIAPGEGIARQRKRQRRFLSIDMRGAMLPCCWRPRRASTSPPDERMQALTGRKHLHALL